MKLTNKQLGVLASSILKTLEEKRESKIKELKNKQEFEKALILFKASESYSAVHDYEILQNKIEDLQEIVNKINSNITFIVGENRYSFYIPSTLEKLEELFAKKYFENSLGQLPNKQNIESDIVLCTIEGNENIIETVLNKY